MKKINLALIVLALSVLSPASARAVTIVIGNQPGGSFEGTPAGVNPQTGLPTSSFNNLASVYQSLFGSPSPNALPTQNLWGESPTMLTMGFSAEGANVKVETFQELDFDIFGDYWTLDSKLTFDPSSAVIIDPNDHIIWGGTLTHTGKLSTSDFPHEGDDQSGLPMKFNIDLSAGDKEPAMIGQLAHALGVAVEDHPSVGHTDAMIGVLQGRVTSPSIFFDEIEGSYTGIMVALHLGDQPPVVPEPSTLALLGSGLLGMLAQKTRRKKN